MDDRNKDLPLIVSEILIEMHEVKEALNRVATIVLKQQEHTNTMFATIQEESRKSMVYMTSLLTDFRREAQEDREFMTYSLNKSMGQQQQANAAFEQRLITLEAKYNG